MARLDRRSLRALRALARAAATSRAARVSVVEAERTVRRTVEVLALAFDAPRWTVAAWSPAAGTLQVLGLERIRAARATGEAAGPLPEGFDPLHFALRRYLEPGACLVSTAGFHLEASLGALLPALLPTAVSAPASGGLAVRVRTSRPEVIAGLVDSLGGWNALDSPSTMPSRRKPSSRTEARPPAPAKKPARTEARLLGIVSYLLSQPEPVTRQQLFDAFPGDYPAADGPDAAARKAANEKKFTRDKDALRRLGYVLETVEVGMKEGQVAYFIEPCSYTLPALELGPEEASVIWAAGASALRFSDHPLREDLEAALRKLVVGAKGLPPPRAAPDDLAAAADRKADARLEKLVDAWQRRKRVTLSYWRVGEDREVEREVDVYGYASRRGEWLFAGYCHLRKGVRVFYLSRVRSLKVNTRKPSEPDYRIPDDFDIRRWSRQQVWDYAVHPPLAATIRFQGSLAAVARQLVPGARLQTDANGARVARLEVRNLRGLVRQALAWGPDAEVIEPPEGRALARELLAPLAGGAAGGTP